MSAPKSNRETIRNHYERARARYPTLSERSPGDFTVVLGTPPLEYRIYVSPSYPKSPPEVTQNNAPVDLFITANWTVYFSLLSVLDHLALRVSISPPYHFVLDTRELQAAYDSATSSLSDPNARQALVKGLKCLQDLDQKREKAEREAEESEAKAVEALEIASAVVGRLDGLERERRRLYTEVKRLESAAPPKPSREAVQRKLREMDAEIQEAEQQMQAAIGQYAEGDPGGKALGLLMEAATKKKLAIFRKEEIEATFK